jgi:hypothetical protein
MDNIEHIMQGFNAELEKIAGMAGVARAIPGTLGRFGKRQVHALTGWTPKAGIQSIRGGAYEATQRLGKARAAVAPGSAGASPRFTDKVLRRTPEKVHTRAVAAGHKELVSAQRAHASAQKAESMGLTSLPGYVKALKTHGVGSTMKSGFKEQWDSMGPAGRGLMLGFPTVGAGSEVMRESKPGEAGRFSRAGTRLGEMAYMMGPVPIAGQVAAQTVLSGSGKHVGSLFDKRPVKAKNTMAPSTLDPAGGEAEPGDRIISDRASGLGGSAQ